MGASKFDKAIKGQFSANELSAYSTASEFPHLNPEGRVAALAIQLQLDLRHGQMSSTTLGLRFQAPSRAPALKKEKESHLTGYRLATFMGFYQRMERFLDDPGEDPEPAVLSVGDQAFVRPYPGEAASSRSMFDWAVHLACSKGFEVLDDLGGMVADMRPNLDNLLNEVFVLYQIDHKNFQELLER